MTSSKVTDKGHNAGRAPANKGNTYPPEILTRSEVESLIKANSSRAPSGIRNRALIAVLYRGGLRVSEVLDLFPKDVDSNAGTITVLHGKGDRRRTLGLDQGTFSMVERWLDVRRSLDLNARHPLFSTLSGRKLKSSYVRTLLPRLASKAGIEKRVHAHGLRHTLAYELMMEGVPVPVIQKQLGHSSLANTAKYLDHIAPRDVIKTGRERGEWLS